MPDRLRYLQQEKAELLTRAEARREAAASRPFTDEEQAADAADLARLKALGPEMEAEEAFREYQRTQARVIDNPAAPLSPAQRASVLVKDLAEADPMRGFKTPREFVMAVMDAGRGRALDPRLAGLRVPIQATAGSDEQGTYSDPYGGFFVPVALAPTLLQLRPENDPISPLVTTVPLTAPTVKFNARVDKDHATSVSGGFTVTRKPETVAGASSRAQYEQVTLTADELFGVAYATERLLTDSPVSFAAIIAAGFRDQMADHVIEERFNGNGDGEFLGFMKSLCLVVVAKESGQAADTIVTQNIDKMVARCWRYGSAVWHANNTTFPQLQGLTRAIGTGGSIVNYLTWAPGGQMYLLGRPLYLTEHCSALGDLGDLALCVWSEFLEGTYESLQAAESVHVRFIEHERTFKFWLRNGGAPWWRSPLTPKRGDTLSPFVTLAAR